MDILENAKIVADAKLSDAEVVADAKLSYAKVIADAKLVDAKVIADAKLLDAEAVLQLLIDQDEIKKKALEDLIAINRLAKIKLREDDVRRKLEKEKHM